MDYPSSLHPGATEVQSLDAEESVMPCARCGANAADHLPQKFDHKYVDDDFEAVVDPPDTSGAGVPDERCWICNAPDGRKIETTLRNKHLCSECSDALADFALGLRCRLALFAIDAKYRTGFAAKCVDATE
jgi:hypothetical protein